MKKKILVIGIISLLVLLSLNLPFIATGLSVIKKSNSFLTTDGERNPIYATAEIPHLEPGDLMFYYTDVWDPTEEDLGHARLYKGYDSKYEKYVFIEAWSNIRTRSFSKEYLEQGLWIFARVKTANETQKQNAVNFAEAQIDKQFQFPYHNKSFDPDNENDPYSDKWYCSELVWAAYYNCNGSIGEGIDIDFDGWNVLEGDKYATVMPEDILADDDVERIGSTVNKRKNDIENPILKIIFKVLLSFLK